MQGDIERVIIDEDRLSGRVGEMAAEITARYSGYDEPMLLVPVLNGALVFVADLMRQLPIKMRLGMMAVSSYPGQSTESRGARIKRSLDSDLEIRGRRILIVDDILDTGNTLGVVQQEIASKQPASLETAVLLRKCDKDHGGVTADYIGFDIADEFVVGYGLDFDGHYRNLPHIAVLKPQAYQRVGCSSEGQDGRAT